MHKTNTLQDRNTLSRVHLIGCRGVRLFLSKDYLKICKNIFFRIGGLEFCYILSLSFVTSWVFDFHHNCCFWFFFGPIRAFEFCCCFSFFTNLVFKFGQYLSFWTVTFIYFFQTFFTICGCWLFFWWNKFVCCKLFIEEKKRERGGRGLVFF